MDHHNIQTAIIEKPILSRPSTIARAIFTKHKTAADKGEPSRFPKQLAESVNLALGGRGRPKEVRVAQ